MRFTLMLVIVFVHMAWIQAQDHMVAGWTFPGNSLAADTGASINLTQELMTMGGTSDPEIKNGYTSKAAQATGWDGGAGQKAWIVACNAQGFWNLTISSRQQSGGNDPGPHYYVVQYSIDGGVIWNGLEGGDITVENDWENSFVDQLSLPEECDDQSDLMIRWLMASNEASGSGGEVVASGKTKIDEIFITGELADAYEEISQRIFTITPAGSSGSLRIQALDVMEAITVYSMQGQAIHLTNLNSSTVEIDASAIRGNEIVVITVLMKRDKKKYSCKYYLH